MLVAGANIGQINHSGKPRALFSKSFFCRPPPIALRQPPRRRAQTLRPKPASQPRTTVPHRSTAHPAGASRGAQGAGCRSGPRIASANRRSRQATARRPDRRPNSADKNRRQKSQPRPRPKKENDPHRCGSSLKWEHADLNRRPPACRAGALNQLSYAPFIKKPPTLL